MEHIAFGTNCCLQ